LYELWLSGNRREFVGLLFAEFCWVSFEPFLAGYAAEIVGFAIVSDFEFCCFVVQD
jgi:hypothetical protein